MEPTATGRKTYDLHTSRANGSESTPYFEEPFEEYKANLYMDWRLTIYVPDSLIEGSKLMFDIDYDIELWENILIEKFEGEILTHLILSS